MHNAALILTIVVEALAAFNFYTGLPRESAFYNAVEVITPLLLVSPTNLCEMYIIHTFQFL